MKKVFAFIMAVLYLAVSTGLAVEVHHCMGEIKDLSFAVSNSSDCNFCGMKKGSNNCCKDELKFVKLQDSYKLLNVNYTLSVPEADLQHNRYLLNYNEESNTLLATRPAPSPPTYKTTSLVILNRVFRI